MLIVGRPRSRVCKSWVFSAAGHLDGLTPNKGADMAAADSSSTGRVTCEYTPSAAAAAE